MSRSNPVETKRNPAVRWYQWSGKNGNVSYYDKEKKQSVDVTLPFGFILLDELSTIKGWHDASDSGISSNEVRNMRLDPLVVRSFKGGELANGLYADIKDRVAAVGGHYVTNIYIAAKIDGGLKLASLQLGGAALSSWFEFRKAAGQEIYKGAIQINGFKEGKKGAVVFKTPTFKLAPLSDESNEQALELDRQLQAFLTDYLAQSRTEAPSPQIPQVDNVVPKATDSDNDYHPFEECKENPPANPDDVPF